MKNYSEMTDFEINKAVAIVQGYDTDVAQHFMDAGLSAVKTTEGSLNYCKSWGDAGPIIAQNEISLLKDDGLYLWCASSSAYWADGIEWQIGQDVMHSNPLRAAMISFLMIQEKKNANS